MLIIWTNNWSGVTLIYELEREKKRKKSSRESKMTIYFCVPKDNKKKGLVDNFL